MTVGNNHPFRIIETNISGGRGNHNQRQVDETDSYIRQNYAADYTKVGVIAPYRNQAEMLQKQLPSGVEADKISKIAGIVGIAIGRAANPASVDPRATPKHATRARVRSGGILHCLILRCSCRIVTIPV